MQHGHLYLSMKNFHLIVRSCSWEHLLMDLLLLLPALVIPTIKSTLRYPRFKQPQNPTSDKEEQKLRIEKSDTCLLLKLPSV